MFLLKKIAGEILDDIKCDEDRRAEADTFLQTSIKKILNHLRKGGDLDAFVPRKAPVEGEEAENEETNEAIKQINEYRHRRIEMSDDILKLLEHFNFEDEEETDED